MNAHSPRIDPASDKTLFRGQRFRVVQRQQLGPGDQTHSKEVILHPGAVVIIPCLGDDRICLIRNFRAAVGRTLVELPAGTRDPQEQPLETARRELLEETGYQAGHWEPLCQLTMSPGILDERMHVFVARDLTAGDAAREPGEWIDNLVVRREEAVAMCLDGRIEDAKSLAALLIFKQTAR